MVIPKIASQDRTHLRTDEQIFDIPVPKVVDELVEERISERIVEQIVDVLVLQILDDIFKVAYRCAQDLVSGICRGRRNYSSGATF